MLTFLAGARAIRSQREKDNFGRSRDGDTGWYCSGCVWLGEHGMFEITHTSFESTRIRLSKYVKIK